VLVTALAIVDDLGAVLVIALFYTGTIAWAMLAFAAITLALLFALNTAGVRVVLPYVVLGIVLWLFVLGSGVHATIAGVLLAFTIPATRAIDAPQFLKRARSLVDEFAEDVGPDSPELSADQRDAIDSLESAANAVQSPLLNLEHALHPWVAFFIMPVFALSNAGVALGGDIAALAASPITLGVIAGLVIGKPIGILAFSWVAVRVGIAALPRGVGWGAITGAALLAGIGFTLSLFIAGLAFADAAMLDAAKIGIIVASVIAGVAGAVVLVRAKTGAA
jgi:NhaA family Na+:H+ antiporter